MKKLYFLLCLSALAVVFTASQPGKDTISELLAKLEKAAGNYQQEKVHLHFDKPYYAIGDDIWFKAYIVNAHTAELSEISNVLYVELVDENERITKVTLPVENGLTWGDFKLPDSLSEGNYRVRAYTTWMRNADPAFFFDKTIRIGNAFYNKVFTSTSYTYKQENNVNKVSAGIIFKDEKGKPYPKNEIKYTVLLGKKEIKKGSVITGENGEANIQFDAPLKSESGMLVATLTLPNKKKVVKNIPITATSAATDVQFFPEGGYMVQGLPGKIALKAVNASGKGEMVSGTIVNSKNEEAASFKTSELGMGNFFLTPAEGTTYSAQVKFKDGSSRTVPLPVAKAQGHVLTVSQADSSKLDVKILQSISLLKSTGNLTLVGQRNGAIYFATKLPAGKQIISAAVPTSEIPSGIIQITLFSADNVPVCERIAFVNNVHDKIDLQVQGLAASYKKRGRTKLSITAKNKQEPVRGNFSVAVTNEDIVKPDAENESNIFTSLLLTSDLKGYVEKPNHYFITANANRRTELDDLLLTQGWRRLEWDKLDLKDPQFQPETMLKISGTVTDKGKPVANGPISLMGTSGGFFKLDTLTDANGRFMFDHLTYRDSTHFLIQARTADGKREVKVVTDPVLIGILTANRNAADVDPNVNETIFSYIRQSNEFFNEQVKRGVIPQGILIEEVVVTADRMAAVRNLAPNSVNLNGPGRANAVITEKEMEHMVGSLMNLLRAKSTMRTIPKKLIWDGNIFTDTNDVTERINAIDLQELESVEILTSMQYTAIYRDSTVVIVTSRKTSRRPDQLKYAPGVIPYLSRGYNPSRLFYAPVYENNLFPDPDLRTTVYWNPNVGTDENGKGILDFYNNDKPGNYRMVIEGIDAAGMLARKVVRYRVE